MIEETGRRWERARERKIKKKKKRIFNYYKLGDNFAIKWVFS